MKGIFWQMTKFNGCYSLRLNNSCLTNTYDKNKKIYYTYDDQSIYINFLYNSLLRIMDSFPIDLIKFL